MKGIQPVIYRVAKARGLQDADAHELVQHVLVAVARAVDRHAVLTQTNFKKLQSPECETIRWPIGALSAAQPLP